MMNLSEDRAAAVAAGIADARRAIDLNDRDPLGYCAYGFIQTVGHEFSDASRRFRHSLGLIPVLRERIMVWGCRFFDGIGTNDAESWVALEMAIRLSPNDPLMWAFLNLQGMIRFNAEGYDAASEIFQRASRLPNGLYWIPIGLAACSWQLGDEQGARDIIDAARTDYPGLSYATVINFAGPGIRSLYSDILLKAGLPEE